MLDKQKDITMKCSRCNSKLSNMHSYTHQTVSSGVEELHLCDDCMASCLSRLLGSQGVGARNFQILKEFLNEEAKRK